MPVEVKVVVGTNLFYDNANKAAREGETGDLNIFMDSRLVGSVKADHWTSWEAYDELIEDEPEPPFGEMIEEVDEYEEETELGSDVDEDRNGDGKAQ